MSEYRIPEKCILHKSLVNILSMSVHDVFVILVDMLMRGLKERDSRRSRCDCVSNVCHSVAYSARSRPSMRGARPRRSSSEPVFGNRKAPARCSLGPDSGRPAGTPTALAEVLPEESPSAKFTWVLAMVGANTDGTNRREVM